MILPDEYTVDHLTDVLRRELTSTSRVSALNQASAAIDGHDGVSAACDAVEELLRRG
jgi:hypothetical protein